MTRKISFLTRPEKTPTIYAYEFTESKAHQDYLKIGYTTRDAKTRVKEQLQTSRMSYKIVMVESAMRQDGSSFTDKDVHRHLRKKGFLRLEPHNSSCEWFKCGVDDVKAAIIALRTGKENEENRSQSFEMRPEQKQAVEKTADYFAQAKKENLYTPSFLWNAKMRFGKTFATYQLAKKMGLARILVLTFKPAVESAWREDLLAHTDFEGWQYISNKDANDHNCNIDEAFQHIDPQKPVVVFGSFQDLLGKNENGGIKAKNEFIHTTNWDLVVFDEYHYGAWRDRASKLFENQNEEDTNSFDSETYQKEEANNALSENDLPITTHYYLSLSGTPFRAIYTGTFIEEQIFNWTYADEQRAKAEWKGKNNPYEALPQMVMLTYKMPKEIEDIALEGEFNEFDLNLFFAAQGTGDNARFTHKDEVQKWLNLIRGGHTPFSKDDLKREKNSRPPMPFSDTSLLQVLSHTLWFLPNIAACHAMKNLLEEKQNSFYHDYKVIVCAGPEAGVGLAALHKLQAQMGDPLHTKTITLTCGKLTTGVTVKPWTGIFMLCNLRSPETYFQAAFRVQSPWEIKNEAGENEILKRQCYVFDFALNRALKQVADYSCRLDITESDPEKKVENFINFLPVLSFDGCGMTKINAQEILDMASTGTSATLLARRWESALLVNVDNHTLYRLLKHKEAMKALMQIEGFRSLNQDIETIITKSESIQKAKKESTEATKKAKKQISEEEKEMKSLRKQVQEKLIKFATRIPVFMYLTDHRERCLKEVIENVESDLFKRVTGLTVKDFHMLCSLGVFNAALMNDAVFKFKRYEDASLSYTGINKHNESEVGGFDASIRKEDYERIYYYNNGGKEETEEV